MFKNSMFKNSMFKNVQRFDKLTVTAVKIERKNLLIF
jgi:hypothetical protein